MDITAFAVSQLALIAREKNADVLQQASLTNQLPPVALVRHGLALTNLVPAGQRTGFGGRTLLDLEPDGAIVSDGKLPPHGVRQGDIVRVEVQPAGSATRKEKADIKDAGVDGVVQRVFDNKVSVAINPAADDSAAVDRILTSGKRLWIVKLANEVTFNRMEQTMTRLKGIAEATAAASPLVDVLFGRTPPSPLKPGYEKAEVTWFDEGLNDSQKEAVRFALASSEVGTLALD